MVADKIFSATVDASLTEMSSFVPVSYEEDSN